MCLLGREPGDACDGPKAKGVARIRQTRQIYLLILNDSQLFTSKILKIRVIRVSVTVLEPFEGMSSTSSTVTNVTCP